MAQNGHTMVCRKFPQKDNGDTEEGDEYLFVDKTIDTFPRPGTQFESRVLNKEELAILSIEEVIAYLG